jgi:NAD-dependent deacetylase
MLRDVETDRALETAVEVLSSAENVLFVTGAGMSADSGLPTYRGIGGLYETEITEEGLAIEDALSGDMLRRNPTLCWKYIHQIESACRGARFHEGHAVLARFEQRTKRVWVLTQNVDGFHLDAGSRNVIEVHGNLRKLSCMKCDWSARVESYADLSVPPRCPKCEGWVRPDVVLFGEALPRAAISTLERELRAGFDAVFVIGTTAVFPYIAAPVVAANQAGIPTVEINPGDSSVSRWVDVRVRVGARDALERLEHALNAKQ